MPGFTRALAIGSAAAGAAATASLAWVMAGRAPQSAAANAPQPNRPSPAIVCAASDSILRETDAAACASGQTQVLLTRTDRASSVPAILDPDEGAGSKRSDRPPDDGDYIGELQRRLDNLRRSPLFTVIDAHGGPLFAVRPEGILLYNASGLPLVGVRATDDGGFLRTMSADGNLSAWLVASGSQAGVRITEGNVLRLDLGRRESTTYSLKVRSPKSPDNVIAGIGESKGGNGALIVGDLEGRLKVSMTAVEGKGEFRVFHQNGSAVVSLRESTPGSGLLMIGDENSTPMVKMVVNDDRYGVVLAGPVGVVPLVPRSGLPGSYFLGCAGGSACRP